MVVGFDPIFSNAHRPDRVAIVDDGPALAASAADTALLDPLFHAHLLSATQKLTHDTALRLALGGRDKEERLAAKTRTRTVREPPE